jgi:DNA modification methylase
VSISAVLANEQRWHVEVCDVMEGLKAFPDCVVQSCVTSPPYYGLRDYGSASQIGLEKVPELYIERLVSVFREVRRVLRPGGTLWLNIGDSYANDGKFGGETGGKQSYLDDSNRKRVGRETRATGLAPKNLIGIPWMLAFAMRADGWVIRNEIIWHKANVMPESVSDRTSKSHETIFLLTKQPQYFYDAFAIREKGASGPSDLKKMAEAKERLGGKTLDDKAPLHAANGSTNIGKKRAVGEPGFRNRRDVWTINTVPYSGAHFAVFPPLLPELCLKAGTSEKGQCSLCGAPWQRIIDSERQATRPGTKTKTAGRNSRMYQRRDPQRSEPYKAERHASEIGNRDPGRHVTTSVTVGWEPTCTCNAGTVPQLILDPFCGSGTTLLVAKSLGLRGIGLEVNPDYAEMAKRRIDNGFIEEPVGVTPSADQRALFE